MKKIILSLAIVTLLWSCKPAEITTTKSNDVAVTIDLNNVKDDKVMVTVIAPSITSDEIVYSVPKIIPGTYMVDNYGKLIDEFKAFDKNGTILSITKVDENSWSIKNATA
ncbi:MAG: peptidase M61, partial [Bacteroidota bacterium]